MKKEYISTADTAKLIRKALQRAYPGQKFYVRSQSYSGGASIHVYWQDGPTETEVKQITCPFEGAGFDGMIDLKFYYAAWLMPDGTVSAVSTPGTEGSRGIYPRIEDQPKPHPNAKRVHFMADFIFLHRSFSRELVEQIAQRVHKRTGWNTPEIISREMWVAGKKKTDGAFFQVNYNDPQETEYIDALAMTSAYHPPEKQNGGKKGDGVTIEQDRDWLWVHFPAKPTPSILDELKALGGRWSRKRQGWYFTNAEAVNHQIEALLA